MKWNGQRPNRSVGKRSFHAVGVKQNYPDTPSYYYECGRRLWGLGTRGKTGVTGIAFGGVFAGRLAACVASASEMRLLVTGFSWVLFDDCLNGWARIWHQS
jgi:hypothetical protein